MSDPFKRKRRCEFCKHWEDPESSMYMGRCLKVLDSGLIRCIAPPYTSRHFYCCEFWKKDENVS